MPSYSPSSIKGKALHEEVLSLLAKEVIELAPPSPGYYSRLFVVWKTSGSWRLVIDLSCLNRFVTQTRFKIEANQLVLGAIRRDDWMVSIDLKETYLQIPVYLYSRQFCSFMAFRDVVLIQGALFRSLHSSAGLHMGHVSSFCDASSSRDLHAPVL